LDLALSVRCSDLLAMSLMRVYSNILSGLKSSRVRRRGVSVGLTR
jgi:hypothetical protein